MATVMGSYFSPFPRCLQPKCAWLWPWPLQWVKFKWKYANEKPYITSNVMATVGLHFCLSVIVCKIMRMNFRNNALLFTYRMAIADDGNGMAYNLIEKMTDLSPLIGVGPFMICALMHYNCSLIVKQDQLDVSWCTSWGKSAGTSFALSKTILSHKRQVIKVSSHVCASSHCFREIKILNSYSL